MAESHEQRIERILRKLNQVRQQGLTCFGSEKHQFRLHPPLDEKSLSAFELKHGMRLPADYRSFLKLAGNGGVGPYYGIDPLEKWSDFNDWVSSDTPANILALPCPLRPEMSRDKGWEWQLGACVSPYQGLISIGSQGCTYVMGLIVTGEFAGRVVYLDADGQTPYVSREPDFLSWYERWLDELLGGHDTFWFGYGLGGDEHHLLGLLENPSTPESDRTDAVYGLRRLPQLSSRGRDQICHLLADRVDGVRAAACHVAEKFEIVAAKKRVADLLDDPVAEVRKAAISASTKLKIDICAEKWLGLLHSADVDVAQQAFFEFQKKGIPREVLLQLVESPHGQIRYLAAHAVKWKPEDTELLIRLLSDKHPQVRFYSVLGLRQIRATSALGAVMELLEREDFEQTIDSILRMLGEVPGQRNGDVLLEWANRSDDFYRLTAVDSLCKLGDERVEPVARQLLAETRSPVRIDSYGLPSISNVHSISHLVRESLSASPSSRLQRLVPRFRWPKWLTFN